MTEWTHLDAAAANSEGWDVFDSSGSANGAWQIQRLDCPDDWPSPPEKSIEEDGDAWTLVREGAAAGSPLHVRALAFIRENCSEEYVRIMIHPVGTVMNNATTERIGPHSLREVEPTEWWIEFETPLGVVHSDHVRDPDELFSIFGAT